MFVGLGIGLAVLHQSQLASYSGRATGVVVDFQIRRAPSSRASNPSLAPVVAFSVDWFFSLVTGGAGLFFFLLGLAVRRRRPG